jgi:hypothetical protein
LVFAVYGFFHPAAEESRVILREQRIPVGAPEDFNHVPTGPTEGSFKLIDDLAVAPNRPVQPLEIAVDDENQVIELLAGR